MALKKAIGYFKSSDLLDATRLNKLAQNSIFEGDGELTALQDGACVVDSDSKAKYRYNSLHISPMTAHVTSM